MNLNAKQVVFLFACVCFLITCTNPIERFGKGPIILDDAFNPIAAKQLGFKEIKRKNRNGADYYKVDSAFYRGLPCSCTYKFLDDYIVERSFIKKHYFLICQLEAYEDIDSVKLVAMIKEDFKEKVSGLQQFTIRIVFGKSLNKLLLYLGYPLGWYPRPPD